jgi:hypothetical protein
MSRADKHSAASNSATATAKAYDRVELEHRLSQAETPELFCAELSKLFQVRRTEVAMMRLEKGQLMFLFPTELKTAGSIPVSSSSSVAAHTAATKKTELFNNFVKVRHISLFETVRLGTPETVDRSEQASIQKLMSAPVMHQNKALGVIQVCRKGFDLPSVGPDFSLDDLQKLEAVTKIAASMTLFKSDSSE